MLYQADAMAERSNAFLRDSSTWPDRPIIVVTGGNSGVGFGLCQRLIDQLVSPPVSDLQTASPIPAGASPPDSPFATPHGLTLVLACRNAKKAQVACQSLLARARQLAAMRGSGRAGADSSEAGEHKGQANPDLLTEAEYRQLWLTNLRVEVVSIDLASFASVTKCAQELKQRYPYVSHLMLNAGGGPFTGLHWARLFGSLLRNFVLAVTFPVYIREEVGGETADGLGWTWQINVFGHFVLARDLLPHLAKSPFASPRIVWTGSIDGTPDAFTAEDRYSLLTENSYKSTKFQVGLLAWAFNNLIGEQGGEQARVKSFLAHPGVVAGNLFYDVLGIVLDFGMKLVFYLARLLGSVHHVVSPYKSSIALVYVALAPLSLLYAHIAVTEGGQVDDERKLPWLPIRFGSRVTRLGRPYVGVDYVVPPSAEHKKERTLPVEVPTWFDLSADQIREQRWWWNAALAKDVLDHCEQLRDKLRDREGLR